MLDASLRAAAAWTQQIPSHGQDAETLRREEQLHRVCRRRAPEPRHCQGPNAAERQHRCVQQKVGELRCQTMTREIAIERGEQAVKASARCRLYQLLCAGAW